MQQDDPIERMRKIDVRETHIMKSRKDAITALYGKDRKLKGIINSIIEIDRSNAVIEKMYDIAYYDSKSV